MKLPFACMEAFFLPGHSALEHLARECAFLPSATRGRSFLLFYVNSPCLIIGRNQNPWKEIAPGSRLPCYRRESGGGTVYHDLGNLNWAFIVPRGIHDQDAELDAMAKAVSSLGLDVEPGPRGGLYLGASSSQPGAKVSGTARRFAPESVLHHGTLLISSDLAAMESALSGMKFQDDSSLPSAPARTANLVGEGLGLPPREVASALAIALGARNLETEAEDLGADAIYRSALEGLASSRWIYGKTPRFCIGLGSGPAAGEDGNTHSLLLAVEGGKPAHLLMGPDKEAIPLPPSFTDRYFSPTLLEELKAWVDASFAHLRGPGSVLY
ncbi:MAG TPA: lipoate--protein ligase family protein [Rectinemataceae bacterium]